MIPSSYQGIAFLLFAIVPGYLAIAAWARAKTWRGMGTDLQTIIKSIVFSFVVQIVCAPITIWWLYPYWRANTLPHHPRDIVLWLLLVVLVVPLVGGTVAGLTSDWIFAHTPILPPPVAPSSWDSFFTEDIPDSAILVIEFTDGKKVAGGWGVGSYAITSPEPHGIFLAVEWKLDDAGHPIEQVLDSAGVLIQDATTIRNIRVLLPASGDAGNTPAPQPWWRLLLAGIRRLYTCLTGSR